jgi:GNAT superfamily N-acetyltransferase
MCSIIRKSRVVRGCAADYKGLGGFHYRAGRPGPYSAIFKLEVEIRGKKITAGVIVYTMPSPRLELRNIATGNFFAGYDRATQLALINANIRRISRVVIEPRFRGLGLAGRLVRETMPEMNVAIIEAMAVMGLINPFFERAGMTAFKAALPSRHIRLIEALSTVGIEKEELSQAQRVQRKLEGLGEDEREFLEVQIQYFLKGYGGRRYMQAGRERTEFILSRLTRRPVYYIWFNPQKPIGV